MAYSSSAAEQMDTSDSFFSLLINNYQSNLELTDQMMISELFFK